ncbi:MAG TPA: hypothetical protein PK156_08315, partial [Polyangium sp.]|nr:hypothetical protein [Polyangium sp.]
MLFNRTKMLLIPLFGTIWGCSPRTFDPDEALASQSSSLQIVDVAGSASFHHTRPSFGAYADRSAIRLQDGRVLVAGGHVPLLNQSTNRAEVFDPVTERWTELPPMRNAHVGAKMFLLQDGRVVILGGLLGAIDTPEVFDPQSKTWTVGEQLASPIWNDLVDAALLDNGKVLVASGYFDSMAYFFDTNTLTWSPAPPLKYSRIYHSLTLLKDGRVLAAGGKGHDQVSMIDEDRLIAEIFDPTTNQWSDAASLNAAHSGHLVSLLDDGRVLLVDLETTDFEIFNPQAGSVGLWSLQGSYQNPSRLFTTLTTLADGRRMLVGGFEGEGVDVQNLVFSPDNEYWAPVGRLRTSRQNLTATLLDDGRVLIAGGMSIDVDGSNPPVPTAELFVPDEPSVWRFLGEQPEQLGNHTSTRLNDGRVLLAGYSANLQDSFIFLPETNTFVPTASLTN